MKVLVRRKFGVPNSTDGSWIRRCSEQGKDSRETFSATLGEYKIWADCKSVRVEVGNHLFDSYSKFWQVVKPITKTFEDLL